MKIYVQDLSLLLNNKWSLLYNYRQKQKTATFLVIVKNT